MSTIWRRLDSAADNIDRLEEHIVHMTRWTSVEQWLAKSDGIDSW